MFILGLTGSIGMGKSTAAAAFRRFGLPVHDSDATVHALMGRGGDAVSAVSDAFPGAVVDGAVDRKVLGARVFGDTAALRQLEAILHPLVRRSEQRFLGQWMRLRVPAVVLDIPLLFETGGEGRCDAVAVVSAPAREQRRRVLARHGMTVEKFENILSHQIEDKLKCRAADFVIQTGLGRAFSLQQIRRIATLVSMSSGDRWPPFWQPRQSPHA